MRLQELSEAIREARRAHGLTQAGLAAKVGISRETLNLLENGLVRDLGVRKVFRLLDQLGLDLAVRTRERSNKPDYVRMACTVANVSFRDTLTEDELVRALATGKVRANRRAH